MSETSFNPTLADADVRIEAMYWIQSLVSVDATPREFREFCDDLADLADSRPDAQIFEALPRLKTGIGEDGAFDPEWVAEDLRWGPGGFIVQAATPCRRYQDDGRQHYYSWGEYWTEWLYAANETDIQGVLAKWAEDRHESDRAKATGAQP